MPSTRSIEHTLLDHGLDSLHILGWAPSCAPNRGAYFEARRAGGEVVTGTVCCARAEYHCDVELVAL